MSSDGTGPIIGVSEGGASGASPWSRRLTCLAPWLLIPLIVGAWSVIHFRTAAAYPVDAVPSYLAGRMFGAGQLDAVYHQSIWPTLAEMHPAWLAEANRLRLAPPSTSFVYGPSYLVLIWPLASWLTPQQFFWLLAYLSAGCSVYLGLATADWARLPRPWAGWLLALLFGLSFPVAYAGLLGQNVVIAAALTLAAFRHLARGKRTRCVVLLLLACVIKPWCALLLGVLLLLRELRAFAAAVAGHLLAFVALPKLLVPAVLLDAHAGVLAKLPQVSVLAYNNVSVRALLDRIGFPGWTAHTATWNAERVVSSRLFLVEATIALGVALCFAVLVWTKRPSVERAGPAAMALVLVPLGVCWSHYLVFCLPLLALVTLREGPLWLRALAVCSGLWLMRLLVLFAPAQAALSPPWLWAILLSAPLLLTSVVALSTLWTTPARAP